MSIRAIAHRVGVSPPSIYRHFADKDALIDAAISDVFEDLGARMKAAGDTADEPMECLRRQGHAYVDFAREHPEQYRLATMLKAGVNGTIDQVLSASAFKHFSQAVRDCIDAGIFRADSDVLQISLEMWASAHGVASLLIAKPYLPWGDIDTAIDRILRSACLGRAVTDLLDDPEPEQVLTWLAEQRK